MDGGFAWSSVILLLVAVCDVCLGQRPVGVCPPMRPNHCGGVNFALDDEPLSKDCQDIYDKGKTQSGVYTVFPTDIGFCAPLRVYCDMDDGGGWTVFQRRQDGSEDFYLGWGSYRYGFGNLAGEFWLGNDQLYRLTNQDNYVLRIDMEDAEGEKRHALYRGFSIGDEGHHWPLRIGEFISGEAGDSFTTHNGQSFQTRDRESNSCAYTNQGAWWYRYCGQSNLNGLYPLESNPRSTSGRGIYWGSWHGTAYAFSRTQMKFRPAREEDMPQPTEAMSEELVTETTEMEELLTADGVDRGSGLAATRGPIETKTNAKKSKTNKKDKSGRNKSGRRERRSGWNMNLPWVKV